MFEKAHSMLLKVPQVKKTNILRKHQPSLSLRDYLIELIRIRRFNSTTKIASTAREIRRKSYSKTKDKTGSLFIKIFDMGFTSTPAPGNQRICLVL